ncbi:hypothetical protein ACLKA7_012463 [Drosophila subpalustris]
MPDYKLVTAMPVVVLDDEQKLTVGSTTKTTTTATTELNTDASSNISSTGSTASLASTTRNALPVATQLLPLLLLLLACQPANCNKAISELAWSGGGLAGI